MPDVTISIGAFHLTAKFEDQKAPRTCAALRKLLPLTSQVVHVRWSGEAVWVPLGDLELGIPPENATSYPAVGDILVYPGGVSETEILIAYGPCQFASKAGVLAGNHCLTLVSGAEHLRDIGLSALWRGAQPITIGLR